MKNILFIVLLIFVIIPTNILAAGTCGVSGGVTGTDPYMSESASQEDLQYCITQLQGATPENTINIPTDTITWTNGTRLSIAGGIKLIGAGKNNTIITGDYTSANSTTSLITNFLISYEPTAPEDNKIFRLSGISLNGQGLSAGIIIKNMDYSNPLSNIRIDNNYLTGFDGGPGRSIEIYGYISGVADNNEATATGSKFGVEGGELNAWGRTTYAPGTATQMYFEDNIKTIDTTNSISSGSGGKYVSRFNTETYAGTGGVTPWYDVHGNQNNNTGAGMGVEIYNNTLIASNPTSKTINLIDQRGGQGFVFNNEITTSSSNDTYVKIREEWDDVTYPSENIYNLQHVHDSYYWNNTETSILFTNAARVLQDNYTLVPDVDNAPLLLIENVKFWTQRTSTFNGSIAELGSCGYLDDTNCTASGVGVGELESKPTTCTTGVGYWATDQGDWNTLGNDGILYKCTSTDTWEIYYEPYTYPHPLRGEVAPGTSTQVGRNAINVNGTRNAVKIPGSTPGRMGVTIH